MESWGRGGGGGGQGVRGVIRGKHMRAAEYVF